jgi:hypothetical protein
VCVCVCVCCVWKIVGGEVEYIVTIHDNAREPADGIWQKYAMRMHMRISFSLYC